MPTFIKTGFWDKLINNNPSQAKAPKGWFNLDRFVEDKLPAPKYKVYTALLTQSGVDAPESIVLENTIGIVPVFTYNGIGQYQIEFPGLFPIAIGNDKTVIFYRNNSLSECIPITQIQQNFPTTNIFTIYSRASVSFASFTPGQFYNQIMNGVIEIRVYN